MRRPTLWLMFAAAIVFTLVLTYPYLSLNMANSRLEVRDSVRYAVLVVHIFAAAVALVLGPVQFIPKIRAHRRVHRTIGRVYLSVGVLPSALAAIPVALWSGRLLTQIGLITAAVLWLITGGLAYRAARRRNLADHRAWMMRNYALTFLAVTSRVLVPLLLLVQIPFGRVDAGSIGSQAPSMIPLGQTLGWIINLLVAEILVRRISARQKPPLPV
jgi:uncharacterized membrane protein